MLTILVKNMFEGRRLLCRVTEVLWWQWKEYIKKEISMVYIY